MEVGTHNLIKDRTLQIPIGKHYSFRNTKGIYIYILKTSRKFLHLFKCMRKNHLYFFNKILVNSFESFCYE